MKFPCSVVFRNEALRSGKYLSDCASQVELDQRAAEYREKAKSTRKFCAWVAIEFGTGKEIELARGES
jgi:hypothetical protein